MMWLEVTNYQALTPGAGKGSSAACDTHEETSKSNITSSTLIRYADSRCAGRVKVHFTRTASATPSLEPKGTQYWYCWSM